VISPHGLTMMGVVPLGVMLEGAFGAPSGADGRGRGRHRPVLVVVEDDRRGAEGPRDGIE
jgi:hypothetical protein